MRPAFLAAAARPFLRSASTAFSILPFVSLRAFLQSIIPAPVRSRSSLTIWAVISMTRYLLANRSCRRVFGMRTDKRKGQLDARSTDLFLRAGRREPDGARCDPESGRRAARGILVVGRDRQTVLRLDHHLFFHLAGAGEIGVGDARSEQPDGTDGVVVARDREVDQLGIAVRIDDGDHRD